MNIDGSLTAIVTGGASGLGLATVWALREAGAKVALFDVNVEQGEAVAAETGASVPFPKRLGNAPEFASMALEMIRNGYINGQLFRIDGAIRMPPK